MRHRLLTHRTAGATLPPFLRLPACHSQSSDSMAQPERRVMGGRDADRWVGWATVEQSPEGMIRDFQRPEAVRPMRYPVEIADVDVIHRDAVLRVRGVVRFDAHADPRLQDRPDSTG